MGGESTWLDWPLGGTMFAIETLEKGWYDEWGGTMSGMEMFYTASAEATRLVAIERHFIVMRSLG